jgi:hypothetical protein
MYQEDLVDEIVEIAFHSEPSDPNRYTNERMKRAEIWDLIQTYDKEREKEEGELLSDQLEDAEDTIQAQKTELLRYRPEAPE